MSPVLRCRKLQCPSESGKLFDDLAIISNFIDDAAILMKPSSSAYQSTPSNLYACPLSVPLVQNLLMLEHHVDSISHERLEISR